MKTLILFCHREAETPNKSPFTGKFVDAKCSHNNRVVILIEHAQSGGIFMASHSMLHTRGHKLQTLRVWGKVYIKKRATIEIKSNLGELGWKITQLVRNHFYSLHRWSRQTEEKRWMAFLKMQLLDSQVHTHCQLLQS